MALNQSVCVTPGIHANSRANVIQFITLPLLPRNNKRLLVEHKESSFFMSHDEILFSFLQLWATAPGSLFKFHGISFFQVGLLLLDYLFQFYLICDPGLFPEITFIDQQNFAYNNWKCKTKLLVNQFIYMKLITCNAKAYFRFLLRRTGHGHWSSIVFLLSQQRMVSIIKEYSI